MQLFCPTCQAAFSGTQRCPRCSGLLLLPQEVAETTAQRAKVAPPPPVYPSPLGRVVVGATLALGLYLALRKFVMGAVMASEYELEAWWASVEGLSAVCGIQVAAVIFGSAIAAAGRTGGFLFGVVVGGVCGGLFFGAELLAGAPARDLVLYIQPLVLVCTGAIAGVLAARVWGAVPVLDMPVASRGTLRSSQFTLGKTVEERRPTAWLRILVGAVVMLVAIAAADRVRSGAQKYSGGLLRVTSVGQGQFLSWQIAVLGVLAGGAVAGAGTGAGLRHGVVSGILGGAGVLGMTAFAGQTFGPVAYWLGKLQLGTLPPTDPAAIVAAASGVLLLGVLGGWLGGTLFLPLAPEHMRQRLRTGLD